MPPMIDDVEQLNCCKLLGVIFQHNLKMDSYPVCSENVSAKVTTSTVSCSHSIIVSRILYAQPAW